MTTTAMKTKRLGDNGPYSGRHNAIVKKFKLPGINLIAGEKVFVLPETLKKEDRDLSMNWTIGVIKAENPEPEPTCILLNLLTLPKRTRLEINRAKELIEKGN